MNDSQRKAMFAKLSKVPVSQISIDDPKFKDILRGANFHGLPRNIIEKRIQVSKNTIKAIRKSRSQEKRYHGRSTDVSHFDDMMKFESDRLDNAKSALKLDKFTDKKKGFPFIAPNKEKAYWAFVKKEENKPRGKIA